MRVTAQDLKDLEICDDIIQEPLGGAHHDFNLISNNIKDYIVETIKQLQELNIDQLIENRISKYEKMGAWEEIV